jgi:hypothetical protein
MPERLEPSSAASERSAPDTVAPTTRITVAFPLSRISIGESSEQLDAVVELLRELTDLVVTTAPGARAEALRLRAHALVPRAA